jgi:glutamyl-tRNA synthetase
MVNYLMTLGWAPKGDTEIVPWSVIERDFRLEDVTHSPAFFDIKKLTAFNGEYVRMLSVDEFIAACQPFVRGDAAPWPSARFDADVFAAIAPLVQTRVATLGEVPGMIDFLFLESPRLDDVAVTKALAGPGRDVLVATTAAFAALASWTAAELKPALEAVGETFGLKPGKAQASTRVAVTGRAVGPPLYESMELLGRDESLRRMRALAAATA